MASSTVIVGKALIAKFVRFFCPIDIHIDIPFPFRMVPMNALQRKNVAPNFPICKNGKNNLKIYNRTKKKAEVLKGKTDQYYPNRNIILSDEPEENTDILINAKFLGMNTSDKPPIRMDLITHNTLVAEVIVKPEMTCTLIEARKRGCQIHLAIHMLKAQLRLMLEFLEGVQ